jgi:hypothetical protein
MERGDIRTARRLASAAGPPIAPAPHPIPTAPGAASNTPATTGSASPVPGAADHPKTAPREDERTAAERVLERTRPDPVALLAAAAVLAAILLAAWLALLRAH